MKIKLKGEKVKLSAADIRQFEEIRRIFKKAVEKAIEENKKAGIPEEGLYAQPVDFAPDQQAENVAQQSIPADALREIAAILKNVGVASHGDSVAIIMHNFEYERLQQLLVCCDL